LLLVERYGPTIAGLDVAQGGIHPFEGRFAHGCSPAASFDGLMAAPGLGHAGEALKPSLMTAQLATRHLWATTDTALLDRPLTRRSLKWTGWPSGVVSTAATNGILPPALARRSVPRRNKQRPSRPVRSVAGRHHVPS
jgi:hypothetical protein